jgi:ATP-dependent Zn protease
MLQREMVYSVPFLPQKIREQWCGDYASKHTAYHEAGHTVVAYYSSLRDNIHSVTIGSTKNYFGRLKLKFDDEREYTTAEKKDIVKMCYAGMEGDRILAGTRFAYDYGGASSDYRMAWKLLDGPLWHKPALHFRAKAEARAVLQEHRVDLDKMANALLEKRALNRNEIFEILGSPSV